MTRKKKVSVGLGDAMTWLIACKKQIERYVASEEAAHELLGGARSLEERDALVMAEVDGHLLCVVAAHLNTALRGLREQGIPQLTKKTRASAEYMRNKREHWLAAREELREKDRVDPQGRVQAVWSRGWDNTKGHRFGKLSIDRLGSELAEIEPVLQAAIDERRKESGSRPFPLAFRRQANPGRRLPTLHETALYGLEDVAEVVWEWSNGDVAVVLLRIADEFWPNGYAQFVELSHTDGGWRSEGGGNGGSLLKTEPDGRGVYATVLEVDDSIESVTWTWSDGSVTAAEMIGRFAVGVREGVTDEECPWPTLEPSPAPV